MNTKSIFLIWIMAVLPFFLWSANPRETKSLTKPVVVSPKHKNPTAFAIITDRLTYENCKDAILQYRDATEYDGLSTYIVYSDWSNPMDVRQCIEHIYSGCPQLEGIVLVGDIPIAMIRGAQHMTTAFKMNEQKYGIRESSVPSDRFYDDLHLKFNFLKQDTDDKSLFYYQLAENCPQRLNPNFYSARIRHTEGMSGNKYQAISAFLEKAAKAKYTNMNNTLDQIVTYNGGSYNFDCLMVYMDEEKAYRENFPLAFRDGTSFKHWNFRMKRPIKYNILNELERNDLDLFMFHEHGSETKQYVNEYRQGDNNESRISLLKSEIYSSIKRHVERDGNDEDSLIQSMQKKYHLTPEFFEDYNKHDYWEKDSIESEEINISTSDLKDRKTNATFIMFDACYNGSFNDSDYVAGHYIFNSGSTLICQGNTRNVLQDRWTVEMIGLLSHGLRVGQYNRQVATLEGHLIGDPTVHFAPIEKNTLACDEVLRSNDVTFWKQQLMSPYADIQCLALRKLTDIDSLRLNSAFLIDKYKESLWGTVRMECIKLLSRYADANFTEAVRLGLHDPYERIARSCATYAGFIGDPKLIADVVDVMQNDEERIRCQYALNNSIYLFEEDAIIDAMEKYFNTANRVDIEDEKKVSLKAVRDQFEQKRKREQLIFDKTAKEEDRMLSIRLLRNYPRSCGTDKYLSFISDEDNNVRLRVAMAEALGWFSYSYQRKNILFGCRKLLLNENLPDVLRVELVKSINRLF